MSDEPGGMRGSRPSAWTSPGADDTVVLPGGFAAATSWPDSPLRHTYPLAVRDASFAAAFALMLRTLPYAGLRFALLLGYTLATIVWLCVMIGGAAWLGTHIAAPIGWLWFIGWLILHGALWRMFLRYALHLIECGHVAVLTELVIHGRVGNGNEPMFTYGRRIVTQRFGEVTVLFGLQALVRGVIRSFHRTLDWIEELVPIPGLEAVGRLVNMVLKAATRYLDKAVFSYDLARNDTDPWRASKDGLIYYCQNAKPILKTSLWIVVLDRLLTFGVWVVMLAPAALVALMLPPSVRDIGALITIGIAALLAANIRAAFLKPVFLIMIMVRFHALVEGQAINPAWDERLSQISEKFRNMWRGAALAAL